MIVKRNAISTVCLSLLLLTSALPASAQTRRVETVGPRGAESVREATVSPSEGGGVTLERQGEAVGPNESASSRSGQISTDGNRKVTFEGEGTVTGPAGNTAEWESEGTGSYDPETGYEGKRTTTVNGNTYERSTENGVRTLTGSNGGSRVRIRPNRRW